MRLGPLLVLVQTALAAKDHLFRTCDQNPFCKRNRHYAQQVAVAGADFDEMYSVDPASVEIGSGCLAATIIKRVNDLAFDLPLTVSVLESGGVRVSIDEKQRQDGAIEVFGSEAVQKQRYNLTNEIFIQLNKDQTSVFTLENDKVSIAFGAADRALVHFSPFKIELFRGQDRRIVLNERNWLNLEHWRPIEGEGLETHLSAYEIDDGFWSHQHDGFTDKPSRGPEAVALDIELPGFQHVYGIPEHADSLSLRETHGLKDGDHKDPYRLYNVDIFEYDANSPLPMYGSIPLMQAHKAGGSAGVFWANAADTYIDIAKDAQGVNTHWMSETGLLDVFLFLGDHPSEITRQYLSLTGNPALPQISVLGYHQCRWNYNSQDDVLDVHSQFDAYGIPYDVIWLDIEYAHEKRYFTWNPSTFPDQGSMMKQLDATKRKLVPIIDPHIKVANDYEVSQVLRQGNVMVKNAQGSDFEGHCWPGNSMWVDAFHPDAQPAWDQFLAINGSFGRDANNLHIWNDMNEPSVFSGPETSMPRDNVHYGGWEHRDVHNYYGLLVHNMTTNALDKRYNHEQRPFVLTRSFFAGSQRAGAMWTGDNQAKWEFLALATPMVLTANVAGMPFSGADVGGFFGDPSPELLTRWYQVGAFYPFFRGHAHIDTRRREPYLQAEPYRQLITNAIKLRYSLLPTMYTAFYQASVDGSPIMKPLYYVAPDNAQTFAIDNQFFVGDSGIMVVPVTEEAAKSVNVYIPDSESYYDYKAPHKVLTGPKHHSVSVGLDSIPMYLRGGHIHSRRDRCRRSAELMLGDPYTLVIAVGGNGKATGRLMVDDSVSYAYQEGVYALRDFSYDEATGELKSEGTESEEAFGLVPVERIVVVGSTRAATKALISQANRVWETSVKAGDGELVVRNPRMAIGQDFVVKLVK